MTNKTWTTYDMVTAHVRAGYAGIEHIQKYQDDFNKRFNANVDWVNRYKKEIK